MKLNSEFTEDVGLSGFGIKKKPDVIFTRSALVNEKMLRISVDLNPRFIKASESRNSERDADVEEMVKWFEKKIRDWLVTDTSRVEWP